MWKYSTDNDDTSYAEDLRRYVMNADSTDPNKPPWFPRLRLRLTYGTANFREYTERFGLTYPWG